MNYNSYTLYEGAPDGSTPHFSEHYEHPDKKDKSFKSDIICFDSREREMNLYPDPENYSYRLPNVYKNVKSIELLDACIPVSQYSIDTHNNNLDISYSEYNSGSEQNIVIPPGNYKKGSDNVDNSFSKILKESLEEKFPGSTWSVLYNEVNSKITISVSTGTFILKFNTGKHCDTYGSNERGGSIIKYGTNLRSVLGFKLADISSSSPPNSKLSGNSPIDLDGAKYIIFHINDYNRILSDDSGVVNGFAKIALNTKPIKYIEAPAMDKKIIKNFDIPIGKLYKLDIKFSTFGNKYYNFNGVDHSVTFRVTYLD